MRCWLVFALASSLSAADPLPVAAQSDETCIAYMEADAAYKEARMAALRSARENATRVEQAEARAAEAARDRARSTYDTDPTEQNAAALKKAEDDVQNSLLALLDAWKAALLDEGSLLGQWLDGSIAPESAREALVSAYLDAYRGPRSPVGSVMAKLIEADRERCRDRLER